MSTDTLLDTDSWHSRVYSGGWVASHGGDIDDVEPATAAVLGRVGLADAHDVARAATIAAAAQAAWAATNFEERAAVLRRAGDLIHAHAAEIQRWMIRETGAIGGLADFAVGVAAQECYEAAALASRRTPAPRPPGPSVPRLRRTRSCGAQSQSFRRETLARTRELDPRRRATRSAIARWPAAELPAARAERAAHRAACWSRCAAR